jgi:serine/threonine protein kinase
VDQETLHGQISEYRIYELIAQGGFGSVHIGRDTSTNVPVAVKRLHAHLKNDPQIAEKFVQEADTVRSLAHPNIVRLVDQGRESPGCAIHRHGVGRRPDARRLAQRERRISIR